MLEQLSIRDFAVAREVDFRPGAGLNVFTGETGAGKSLVVDALAFVFGARRGREVIAAGAERATVEAVIALAGARMVIERTIALTGRSAARIDGRSATLEELQALGANVVDIHGQSEHLAILRPAVQLSVLDAYAGLESERREVGKMARRLREVRRLLESLARDMRERDRLLDQLRFEVDEIANGALEDGEDEALALERSRLGSVARLTADSAAAIEALNAPAFGEVITATTELTRRDPTCGEISELASALESVAADLGRALRRYRDGLEEDPERLAVIEERLDRLARLKRKYGESVAQVIAYGTRAAERMAALESAEASQAGFAAEAELLAKALGAAATALSHQRRTRAGDLVRAIAAELEKLGMAGATLSVGFACTDAEDGIEADLPDYEVVITERERPEGADPLRRAFTEAGVDRVEFLASFNTGETPRPLASVASGGETSRFMLALTTVLGAAAEPRLVVFDEVDEGVGGRAGSLVGEALARLAERHTVLCVTHLPQVAAFGATHFVVSKHSDGARTWSEIREATGAERVDELAAMLGAVTPATKATATEMLAQAGRR